MPTETPIVLFVSACRSTSGAVAISVTANGEPEKRLIGQGENEAAELGASTPMERHQRSGQVVGGRPALFLYRVQSDPVRGTARAPTCTGEASLHG